MKGVDEMDVRQRTLVERDELMTTRREGVGEERGCKYTDGRTDGQCKCEGREDREDIWAIDG